MKAIKFPLIAALVLVGSLGWFYFGFLAGLSFLWEDLLYMAHPAFNYLITSLASGHMPLWLTGVRCGVPFYGEPWAYYPPLWALCLSVKAGALSSLAIQWFFVGQLFLGGWFVYLFLKANRLDVWPCLAGMVVLVFSAFLSLHVIHAGMGYAFTWLPLELLFVKKIVGSHKAVRNCIYLSFAIWMSFLSGFPQSVLYNAYFLGAYWLFLAWQKRRKDADMSPWRWVAVTLLECGKIAGVFLVVGLLSSFVILSTVQSWSMSNRQEFGFAQIADLSLPWYYLIHGLVPNFFGVVNGDGSGVPFWGYNKDTLEYATWHGGAWMYWEFGFYAGQLALIAVAVLMYNVRKLWTERREAVFFLCALVPLLLLMLGRYGGLFNVLYHIAPGFSMFRTPARFSGLFDFCLAVLVAMLVDELMKRKQAPEPAGFQDDSKSCSNRRLAGRVNTKRDPGTAAAKVVGQSVTRGVAGMSSPTETSESRYNVQAPLIILGTGYIAFLLWLLAYGERAFPELKEAVFRSNAIEQTLISMVLFVLMAAVVWFMAGNKTGNYSAILAAVLVALAFSDLYLAFHRFHQGKTKPEQYFADRNGLIAQMTQMREQSGPFRFAQLRDGKISEEVVFPRNIGYLYPGYEALEGYILFNLKGYGIFNSITNEQARLDIQNVGVIANADRATGRVSLMRYTNSLPRAKFYSRIKAYDDTKSLCADLDSGRLDYRQEIGLLKEDCVKYGILTAVPAIESKAEVRFIPKNSDEYQISYQTTVPGVIFISESHYPGWQADGGRLPVVSAFGAFKGIVIPEAGSGVITVKFSPRVLWIGLAITLITLMALFMTWILSCRRR